jgi:hypothetical protein
LWYKRNEKEKTVSVSNVVEDYIEFEILSKMRKNFNMIF